MEYSDTCKYHTQDPAEWLCRQCDAKLCRSCLPFGHAPNWGRAGPRCVMCNTEVEYTGNPAEEKPVFWSMLPHFFKYPLQGRTIAIIVLSALLAFLIQYTGFLAIVLVFATMSLITKYSFKIIEVRAENITDAPSINAVINSSEDSLFAKFIMVIVILYGVTYYLSTISESMGIVLGGIITFAMPAITIILAIEKDVGSAVNPLLISRFALRIGWAYILMWFCYEIVINGPFYVIGWIENSVSEHLAFPLLTAISTYFWFSVNCMLGYTVYQYGTELGYYSPIPEKELESVDATTFEKKRALAEAFILLRESKINDARKRIRPLLTQIKDDIELHSFYHQIVILCEDQEALSQHSDFFINLLISKNYIDQAVKIYLDTLEKIPTYHTKNVENNFYIAKNLELKGSKKQALQALMNLHKHQPKSAFVAPGYFLAAQLTMDLFSKVERATKLIDFIIKHYPNNDIIHEAKTYRATLESFQATS